jgi:arginyl-tRNA synthetase
MLNTLKEWEIATLPTRFLSVRCVISCSNLPATASSAYLARHAFQLAQLFNNFYHRHHILTEKDPARGQFPLAAAAVAERALVRWLAELGIVVPEVM